MVFLQFWDHFIIVTHGKSIHCKVVSWFDFCRKKPIFWHTLRLKKCMQNKILFFILGMPEITLLATKIKFWDHLTIDTLATLLLYSGLRIALGSSESPFLKYLLFRSISHYNPYYNHNNLPQPFKLYQSVEIWCFRNHTTIGNILGGCRILGLDKCAYKNCPIYVRSKVCIAPFHVWSKVYIAPFHVWRKVSISSFFLLCTWKGAMLTLLHTWKRAMQTLLCTLSGDIVSETKKRQKLPFLPIFTNNFNHTFLMTMWPMWQLLRIIFFWGRVPLKEILY